MQGFAAKENPLYGVAHAFTGVVISNITARPPLSLPSIGEFSRSIDFDYGPLFPGVPAWLPASSLAFPRVVLGREIIMPTYRAYLTDANNRVSSYRPIEADTDAAAMHAARQLAEGCDVEVWDLDRKIGRLERLRK